MVGDWAAYVGRFHRERAGITEQVLSRAVAGGQNPYEWLAGAVTDGPVVDVACGSAPLAGMLGDLGYRGFDSSPEELRAARARGASVSMARADELPVAGGSVGTVVCSMGLQVIEPLGAALAEAARVLKPGGRLVAIVPAVGPLRWKDRPLLGGLVGSLGRAIRYPNDRVLREPQRLFGAAGLTLVSDERRRFGFRTQGRKDVELLVRSLYLPGVGEWRLRAARGWLRAFARDFPIPIRRFVVGR